MLGYPVNFYKTLLSSQGHNFKCLQEIEVQSGSASGALTVAQRRWGHSFEPDVIRIGRWSDFNETLAERHHQIQA